MWSRKKTSPEIDETEMSPHPDAIQRAASQMVARMAERPPELVDIGDSLPKMPARNRDIDASYGDDPKLWERHGEPKRHTSRLTSRADALFSRFSRLFRRNSSQRNDIRHIAD